MIVHASAVALAGRGCLILGEPGSGKSALAMALLSRGADLVSDDQTVLVRHTDLIEMSAPAAISGLIEARHVGLLASPPVVAPLRLIVDLDRGTSARLPAPRFRHLLGLAHPVILGKGHPGLADVVRLVLAQDPQGTPPDHTGNDA